MDGDPPEVQTAAISLRDNLLQQALAPAVAGETSVGPAPPAPCRRTRDTRSLRTGGGCGTQVPAAPVGARPSRGEQWGPTALLPSKEPLCVRGMDAALGHS